MSHQSGIRCTSELLQAFNTASAQKRAFKVKIEDEQLILSESMERNGDWKSDWDRIEAWINAPKEPVFILYRLDSNKPPDVAKGTWLHQTESMSGRGSWVMTLYIPDNAPVRLKMIYASTKNTLSKDLGEAMFVDYVYCTSREDCLLDGYLRHRQHQNAEAPLTEREKERKQVDEAVAAEAAINISSRRGLGSAGLISFPVSEQATTAVESFGKGDLALVVLCIDTSAEIVNLDFTRTSLEDVGAIAQMEEMSRGLVEPRFLLFRWNDGGRILFALTCPSSSKVKERTLYSSNRGSIISFVESCLGEDASIAKKLELETVSDLNDELLKYEFQAIVTERSSGARMTRPAKPGRRLPTHT
ncbi:MAG: hypothetical protein SGCHY_000584 [Lobulomycetales sp.]